MTLENQTQLRQIQVIKECDTNCTVSNGLSLEHAERKMLQSLPAGPEWNYEECDVKHGPSSWLKAYAPPSCGCQQSPIEIRLSKTKKISSRESAFRLVNYHKRLAGTFMNTGRSVQFVPDAAVEPPEISGGMLDQNYRFVQYHYHWAQNDNGSEHSVDGVCYHAELHLVHKGVKDPSKLAVLGIFLKVADGQDKGGSFSAEEIKALDEIRRYPKYISFVSRDLFSKLPTKKVCQAGGKTHSSKGHSYFAPFVRYDGSLTTPPCTENVIWTVFLDPIPITRQEIEKLRSVEDCSGNIIRNNCRPAQSLNGREIIHAAKIN